MKPIIQLDKNLINKIAAGEVVERPLSVVKELTENAIDAGASVITVEITEGGLTAIRVTDNGGGINISDLPLAFARHATSKIANIDDLFQIETLGFRGEALSSISAVSQVEMITKTPLAVMGTRVEIHGGMPVSSRDIGCTDGTTVIVSNLFYNTPARRKFLKKPATEAGYISDCLERLAIGNPNLTIRYINNSKLVFQTKGNGDLKTALLNVYGHETATKSVPIDAKIETELSSFYLTGMIGKPEIARGNRSHGSFFINGRYIQSKLLTKAVESGMKTMLPNGKFPVYALSLVMPFDALDVNVHPTKMDVRFADEEGVFEFVEGAIRDALETQNLIPTERRKTVSHNNKDPFYRNSADKLQSDLSAYEKESEQSPPTPVPVFESPRGEIPFAHDIIPPPKPAAPTAEFIPEKTISVKEDEGSAASRHRAKFFEHYQIIGLAFNTYWLVTRDDSLFLIDQHAAHERVLYEEILKKAESRNVDAQNLLISVPLRLTQLELQILKENKDIFADFGFEIGGEAERPEILSVPYMMGGAVETGFFTELLDKMSEVGFSQKSPYTYKTELIAMAACKAAIKGGDRTTPAEAEALIKQLLELENPFTCPHGRPTIIEITKGELERRFKR